MMDEVVEKLKIQYNLDEELAKILYDRGLKHPDLIPVTFEPDVKNLTPPEGLVDIPKAVRKLLTAIGRREKICVWGHEDADGVTSTYVLRSTIDFLGGITTYYIPSKATEGHGLSKKGLEIVKDQGVKLIVTVDSGMGSVEEVEIARDMGIDVIITDHHEIPSKLPDTVVINPKLGGTSFPYLAGVGVAFKVAWALLKVYKGWNIEQIVEKKLDLLVMAAIGTLADRVPLWSENRALYLKGRELFDSWRHPFKDAYVELRGEEPEFDVVVSIASAGKSVDGANPSAELFFKKDKEDIKPVLEGLLKDIEAWQAKTEELLQKALGKISRVRNYILLDMDNTEPRYLGFLASKLKDRFGVPTIVMGRKADGTVAAEVRAPKGFNSLDLLNYLSDLFIDYGGHKLASGFSMREENLPHLVEDTEIFFKENGETILPYDLEVDFEKFKHLLPQLEKLSSNGVELQVKINEVSIAEIKQLVIDGVLYDPESKLSGVLLDKKASVIVLFFNGTRAILDVQPEYE